MNPEDMSPEEIAQMQQEQCIFCKIIAGQIPSTKIYEDDSVLAILDINPASEGHIIVIPKKHYQIMPQIPDPELANLFLISKKLSKALLQSYQTGGTSIFVANGGVAGQRAPHFMIHVVPRNKDDGLFNIQKKDIDEARLKQIQQVLIASLSKMFGRPVVETHPKSQPQPQETNSEKTSEENNKENTQENNEQDKTKNENIVNPEEEIADKDKGGADLDSISNMFLK